VLGGTDGWWRDSSVDKGCGASILLVLARRLLCNSEAVLRMKISILSTFCSLACSVAAISVSGSRPGVLQIPLDEHDLSALSVAAEPVITTGDGYFIQQLDHNDPSKGTFKQHFWWNSYYWKGPGSPVILFTPGEAAAGPYGSYLTDSTINGEYAQKIGAAIIMVERMYIYKLSLSVLTQSRSLLWRLFALRSLECRDSPASNGGPSHSRFRAYCKDNAIAI